MTRRGMTSIGLALTVALLLTGCLSMPTGGPVVETHSDGGVNRDPGFNINPKPPQPGDTPAEIVRGFLDAMTATPIQPNTAKEFLTADAAASWRPEHETITYADFAPLRETADGVAVTLPAPDHLDAQGAWQGPLPKSQRTINLPMLSEDGEWRIDDVPDALIVPESWFEQRFRAASLYYFDPTAQILVPEPVFVPRGAQLPSTLIQALLLGPGDKLDRVSQSFIPPDMKVSLSVRVSGEGIADIALSGDASQMTPESIELMMVQLAWTLRQVSGINGLRVSVNDEALPLPDGADFYRIDGGDRYDPAVAQASPLLYGLSQGRLASGASVTAIEPVSGPMGAEPLGVRSVGVSLTAKLAAGVGDDGGTVIEAPVAASDDARARTVYSGGTDLLPPAWDFADRLWLVDNTADGAVVTWYADGHTDTLDVPGISGRRVRAFLISRDGTRLVAVVRRGSGIALMVSRVAHNRNGRVLWATPARTISSVADSDLPVRAIAWRSPIALAVLSPFSRAVAQINAATVDGSPAADDASTTVRGRLRGLAGSPSSDDPLLAITSDSLVDLSSSLQHATSIPEGVTAVTYPG